nr:MAG: hypothetical protein [Gammatorquevirus sp.]
MQNITANDFFTATTYNNDTKTQLWMSIIADSHDNICNCWHPFAHLLASIFPPGHQDRDKTINQILQRDYQEKTCHSGGDAAAGPGLAGGEEREDLPDTEAREEEFPGEELEKLIADAEGAETR